MEKNDIFNVLCCKDTLRSAWQRVLENKGCRGCDGITIEDFSKSLDNNLKELSEDLVSHRYHPFPLMRFSVPKRNKDGMRFLSVPAVRDRVAQTAAFLTTRDIFEAEFEKVSHAYRNGRSVRTAILEIEKWRNKGFRYAVDADIDDFFDNVPHDLLLKKLDKLFNHNCLQDLFRKWIIVQVYDGNRIWTLDKGIPQGSVISPMLANLFLDELDETLLDWGKKLIRYADDFLILSKSKIEAEEDIELTDMILKDLKLDLNPLKTKIVSFDSGFKFLGAIFLYDNVYLPFHRKKEKKWTPELPPPLTLKRYLELNYAD